MMGHNICSEGVIWKIIPKLFFLSLLICRTVQWHIVRTIMVSTHMQFGLMYQLISIKHTSCFKILCNFLRNITLTIAMVEHKSLTRIMLILATESKSASFGFVFLLNASPVIREDLLP